ncbi:hypothetical protein MMC18_002701 [Xylographa bjoerkii]|nr:hypothetical protein [Xylographa bjoerkii]
MALDGNRQQRKVAPAPQYDQRFHGNHASYNDAEYAYRSSESRNSVSSLVHRSSRGIQKSQAHGPNLPRKDFEYAISDLFEQLGKATAFYSAAKGEFEAEIKKVKDYAKPMLGEIWERNVNFLEARHDHPFSEKPAEALFPMTFKSTYQRLEDSLEAAIILKIDRERPDILAFAASAIKKFGQLGPLTTELNLLITYLNNKNTTWDYDRSKGYIDIPAQEDSASGYINSVEQGKQYSAPSCYDCSLVGEMSEQLAE